MHLECWPCFVPRCGRGEERERMNFRAQGRALRLVMLIGVAAAAPARGDDVTDQIKEALSAYGRGDLPTAMAGLEGALNMMRQNRADAYGSLLPAPPAGWKADDVETVSLGVALAGGGT